MSAAEGDDEREVRELYTACYSRLVGVVGAIEGSRAEAEDAVQEAFIRLIGRWARVSRYDDPEAWLRKVALGVVSNRRRKLRNGVRAMLRIGPQRDTLGPTGDAVDVERALRALPAPQRAVLVLYHFVGLDVEGIARELSIPTGTVKSRLSRGRSALAPLLREETDRHV